jgi:hypothetical protein
VPDRFLADLRDVVPPEDLRGDREDVEAQAQVRVVHGG